MRKTPSWIVRAFVVVLGSASSAQVTTRASVGSAGTEGNENSTRAALSGDGRFVAFQSVASNLVPGDTMFSTDIFVRDRASGTTELVSISTSGAHAVDACLDPSISFDGRFVVFDSRASNLVPGDTNGATSDVFVRDRQLGTTTRVSVDSGGTEGNGTSTSPWISSDGRFVAFQSGATNLVAGDTNGAGDVFVHDRQSGTTEIASVDGLGLPGNGSSGLPRISDDGRFVAFVSFATNLVSGDTNGSGDVFVYDRLLGAMERASVNSSGSQANGGCSGPAMSPDGRFVVFASSATSLVGGDTNGFIDVFVRDRQSGTTQRVSVSSTGTEGNNNCGFPGSISADGRYVAFESDASNLVIGDTNARRDAFVHDRQTATTQRVSVGSAGVQGNDDSLLPSISADGRYAAFESDATNLVTGDGNVRTDLFVHDRAATSFTSFCDPGLAGVIACPCANPPSGAGRGCNNSSATGGASLTASGAAYLSQDTLVFTTSGEKPTALSVVWQAPTAIPAGTIMGQGVRCGGGSLKRLYIKSAVGGSITAPNFGAGDPTVSARSAALGVPISGGQSMVYFVSYRDPIVLGGCPPTATFNLTQNGSVVWWN